MKRKINDMKIRIPAISINEAVSRSLVSAFAAELNPTVEELGDLRCAVSEAVTNCIVHAYKYRSFDDPGFIYISVRLYDNREISVEISDNGCGIDNLELALKPSFTTGESGERCGMGLIVMESFTDSLSVRSRPGKGTTVLMRKILKP